MASVGVSGDVKPIPATGFAISGTVIEVTDPKLSASGKKVLLSASATFSNSNSGATDAVTLTGSAKLQKASGGVLLDGDSANGAAGCQLQVVASQTKLSVG